MTCLKPQLPDRFAPLPVAGNNKFACRIHCGLQGIKMIGHRIQVRNPLFFEHAVRYNNIRAEENFIDQEPDLTGRMPAQLNDCNLHAAKCE